MISDLGRGNVSDLIEIRTGVFQSKKLVDRYRGFDQQVGIAVTLARGVWHWSDKVRMNSVQKVLDALESSRNAIFSIYDPDDVLGFKHLPRCGIGDHQFPSKDLYLEAVEKIGKRIVAQENTKGTT